jgi:hypothetical protein
LPELSRFEPDCSLKGEVSASFIAVLTSERTHIRDPRVRKLADGIFEARVSEVSEMKLLIVDFEKNPTPAGAKDLPPSIRP